VASSTATLSNVGIQVATGPNTMLNYSLANTASSQTCLVTIYYSSSSNSWGTLSPLYPTTQLGGGGSIGLLTTCTATPVQVFYGPVSASSLVLNYWGKGSDVQFPTSKRSVDNSTSKRSGKRFDQNCCCSGYMNYNCDGSMSSCCMNSGINGNPVFPGCGCTRPCASCTGHAQEQVSTTDNFYKRRFDKRGYHHYTAPSVSGGSSAQNSFSGYNSLAQFPAGLLNSDGSQNTASGQLFTGHSFY